MRLDGFRLGFRFQGCVSVWFFCLQFMNPWDEGFLTASTFILFPLDLFNIREFWMILLHCSNSNCQTSKVDFPIN